MGIFDDNVVEGFKRGNPGWLRKKPTRTTRQVANLRKENSSLKSRLDQLETLVSDLASKKKSKS